MLQLFGHPVRKIGCFNTRYGPRDVFGIDPAPADAVAALKTLTQTSSARAVCRKLGLAEGWSSINIWRALDAPELTQEEIDNTIAEAEAATVAEREERAAQDARWAAYCVARDTAAVEAKVAEAEAKIAAAQATLSALRDLRSRRSWAIHHAFTEDAARLADLDVLDGRDLARATEIVKKTNANIERARGRVDAHQPGEADLIRAADPETRRLAIYGLDHLTALDADQAEFRNAEGWSRSTTGAGHTLTSLAAEHGDLTSSQAAHALALLRKHVKQLPADLQISLFGHA